MMRLVLSLRQQARRAAQWLASSQPGGSRQLQRAQNFVTSSTIAFAGALAYAAIYGLLGDAPAAGLCLAAALVVAANALLLKTHACFEPAKNVLVATIFCLLLGLTYRLGGLGAPTVIWFALCPAAVIGIGGSRQALIWCGIVLATIAGIYLLDGAGYFPPPVLPSLRLLNMLSITSFLVTITTVVTIFERTNANALCRLDAALDRVLEEKEKAQVTLQSIGDAVITTDADMVIDYLNPIAETLTGWRSSEARGMHMDTVFNIFNEETGQPAVNPIRQCLEKNGIVDMENHTVLLRRGDNAAFHIEDSAAPIRRLDGSILGAVMVFHDVTERKVAQNRLRHIAYHDALTGLPNRALFSKTLLESIGHARASKKQGALLFLDLDRFKSINDSLGHSAGDELLVAVSRRLRRSIREEDVVCRMGGDEFTAVINGIDCPDVAAGIARKFCESLSKPFSIQGKQLRVSTSIGITIFPDDGDDPETLLKNADTAMYFAKQNGRGNHQFFNAAMTAIADDNWQIESALHTALENDEFFLEYQPKLDLSRNVVVGSEALLRWENKDFGRIGPADFIGKLEDSGAIVKVGNWVLKTAVMQAKCWFDDGHPIVTSVNVSALQFRQEGLAAQIGELLRQTGLPPGLLQVEITESLLMDDAERSELVIRELRSLGVKVSLDDFGTGFSSLSYLRRFVIDELKIDRSFVVDMESNDPARKIIGTVIELGQALGMRVTAEGVETESQLSRLRQAGCDEIQGYLLSRPLAAHAFADFLSARRTCGGASLARS